MKLLLYSDFSHMPTKDVLDALKDNVGGVTCLFCSYADEQAPNYTNRAKRTLYRVFSKIIDLHEGYDFKDKIDCIFINGGYNFELSYKLKKYNQFEKIISLVRDGTLYIGNSAGSVMAGEGHEWTSEYEPPRFEVDLEKHKFGFGFIKGNVLVHTSKFIYSDRKKDLVKEVDYIHYLRNKKKLEKYIAIPNNGVAIVEDDKIRLKIYPWKRVIEESKERE